MQTILVTGGAGFIGSHIVNLLIAQGYRVIVLDNLHTGSQADIHPAATFIPGDVRSKDDIDRAFAEGIDAVIHLAGQASIKLSYSDPAHDLTVNTYGTINLLQACLVHRVQRFLFASSMTIYGNPTTVPTPETAPANPVSYYGITKYAAERYVHLTGERTDLTTPLRVTSFRMFNVYGERQSLTNPYQGVLAIFIGRLHRREEIVIHSDGEQARDFVYVGDVARAWVDALDCEATYGQVINLGTGTPTSVNRLCDAALAAVGETRRTYAIRYAPAQLGDLRVSAADISRAKDILGWQPTVSLDVGMQRTLDWARSNA
ncbi:MAG: SDR family NAD(P)-dependent oxidoreductase [Chloroflexota bacterium]|nr:SDR family NAD(P)-dependent oxidoreductase [Chloroflexota bacterium]